MRTFVTARSLTSSRTSVTIDVLLSRLGSVTSAGGATTAVFSRSPRASPGTVPVSVIVTDWPVASIRPVHAPVPVLYEPMLGVPKVAPLRAGAVVSRSVKLRIVLGPLFVTLIRYSTAAPATGSPLVRVFTTARSLTRSISSVTVEVLSLGSGSVTSGGGATVTVFTSSPVATAGTRPVSVNTTDAPVASAGPVQIPVSGSYVPTSTM